MALIDTLLDQIGKSEFDIHALLKLRGAIEDRLLSQRRDLMKQLDAMANAFGGAASVRDSRPSARSGAGSALKARAKPGPKAGGKRGGKAGRWSKRAARRGTHAAGKHAGLSVADAVRKVIEAKGGKVSAGEIKKAFGAAGDKRNLNFTLLTQNGAIKRTGFEPKRPGQKGRAAGIYAVA